MPTTNTASLSLSSNRLKFTIFVQAKFSIKPFDWPAVKTPYLVQLSLFIMDLPILNTSQVMVNFCYNGNKSRSEKRLDDTVQLADTKTPYLVRGGK